MHPAMQAIGRPVRACMRARMWGHSTLRYTGRNQGKLMMYVSLLVNRVFDLDWMVQLSRTDGMDSVIDWAGRMERGRNAIG